MATGVFTVSFDVPRNAASAFAARVADHPEFDGNAVDRHDVDDARNRIDIYFHGRPDDATVASLSALAGEAGAPDTVATVAELPDIDWVSHSLEGLPPVAAGRFLVHGSHDRDKRRGGSEIAIEIEAGQAFGTGHHGTTVGCLMEIDRIASARAIRNAADIGTGTGVLAIALVRLTHRPAVATDIDPVAVRVARENAALNGVRSGLRFAVAAGTADRTLRETAPFDLIVANILAGPLAAMARDLFRIAAPGGDVVLSGLLPHQRRFVGAAYRNAGFRFARGRIVDGWATLVVSKPPELQK